MKMTLEHIVLMLTRPVMIVIKSRVAAHSNQQAVTRLVMKFDAVTESRSRYHAVIDYEHRFAEHEHD
jgi:hypothetical protein